MAYACTDKGYHWILCHGSAVRREEWTLRSDRFMMSFSRQYPIYGAHLKKHSRCLGEKKTRRPFLADSRNYCFSQHLTINLTRPALVFLSFLK